MTTSRALIVGLVAVALFGGLLLLKQKSSSGKKLRVYSWSNYFPEGPVERFAKERGLSVEINYFSSNEELFAKMVAGASGYDVILPSDYMVSRMITREMLHPLDSAQLPNLPHLDKESFQAPYDVGLKYSVPYTRGHTGIVVNTDVVKVPADGVSWALLLQSPDPQHTSLLDDMREVFAACLFWKGKNPNERDAKVLTEVGRDLLQVKKSVSLFSSEPGPLLLKAEINIAHAFTNHATQTAKENPAFKFYFPKEGAVTWTDNLAIPKGSAHVAEAHAFINFFLDPDNAVEATRMNGLGTPNHSAWLKLNPEERTDPRLYPSKEETQRFRFLEDLQGPSLQLMNRLWTEMKSS